MVIREYQIYVARVLKIFHPGFGKIAIFFVYKIIYCNCTFVKVIGQSSVVKLTEYVIDSQ